MMTTETHVHDGNCCGSTEREGLADVVADYLRAVDDLSLDEERKLLPSIQARMRAALRQTQQNASGSTKG